MTNEAQMIEALKAQNSIIEACQKTLTNYLVPDGLSIEAAMYELLGLLDGPHQRFVQEQYLRAVTK